MSRINTELAWALALAFVRTVFCGYRAAHQSITFDESWAYTGFMRGPWAGVLGGHPTNHVLFTLLARSSIKLFGLSELSLRLPTVLAGFFLMWGAFQVLRVATQSRTLRWAAWMALALHPLVLDFCVAARGYGLGLALLVWAVYFAIQSRPVFAGAALGLAIAANYTFAFPAAGLIAALLLLPPGRFFERMRCAVRAGGICAGISLLICGVPLARMPRLPIYGAGTLDESLRNLIWTSLYASPTGLPGHGTAPRLPLLEYAALPLAGGFMVMVALRQFKRPSGSRLALMPLVTLLGAVGALVAAHVLARVPYPYDRTGLHLVVLCGLALATAADRAPAWLRAVFVAGACALVLQFALQMHADYFQMWWFDAKSKDVAVVLRNECEGRPQSSVTAGVFWMNYRSIDFYRELLPIPALRLSSLDHTFSAGALDFYVGNRRLDPDGAAESDRLSLSKIFFDAKSGVVVARGAKP